MNIGKLVLSGGFKMIKRNLYEIYNDYEISIYFNLKPDIALREPSNAKNELELFSIKKYPLRNKQVFTCVVFDKLNFKKYVFTVPKMNYDGASIPKLLWFLVGSNTDPFYRVPSLIHDTLCLNHKLINNNRRLSSKIFRALLLYEKVNICKANIMTFFVDIYQKYFVKW